MFRQTLFILPLIFIGFLALSSCNFSSVYNENVIIEDAKWHKDKAVRFEVPISDSLARFDFYLNLLNEWVWVYNHMQAGIYFLRMVINKTCRTIEFKPYFS